MNDFTQYKATPARPEQKPAAAFADQAKNLARDLSEATSELSGRVADVVKDQASDLGTAAKNFAAGASDQIGGAMNDQKAAGADYVGNIAKMVHRAAGEFEKEIPQAAQYIHMAADQIDTVAAAVRERNVGDLYNEVRDFARRQPTAFFGGAVILGFAAIRFLKSSQSGSERALAPDGKKPVSSAASENAFASARSTNV